MSTAIPKLYLPAHYEPLQKEDKRPSSRENQRYNEPKVAYKLINHTSSSSLPVNDLNTKPSIDKQANPLSFPTVKQKHISLMSENPLDKTRKSFPGIFENQDNHLPSKLHTDTQPNKTQTAWNEVSKSKYKWSEDGMKLSSNGEGSYSARVPKQSYFNHYSAKRDKGLPDTIGENTLSSSFQFFATPSSIKEKKKIRIDSNQAKSSEKRLEELKDDLITSGRVNHAPLNEVTKAQVEANRIFVAKAIQKHKERSVREVQSKDLTNVSFLVKYKEGDRLQKTISSFMERAEANTTNDANKTNSIKVESDQPAILTVQTQNKALNSANRLVRQASEISKVYSLREALTSRYQVKSRSKRDQLPSLESARNITNTDIQNDTKEEVTLAQSSKQKKSFSFVQGVLPTHLQNSSFGESFFEKQFPGSVEELLAVMKLREWKAPNLECFNIGDYSSISYKEKKELFNFSYQQYSNLENERQSCRQTTQKLTAEKLAKYLKSIKSAPDKLQILTLLSWYTNVAKKLVTPPTESNCASYYQIKSTVLTYFLREFIMQLSGLCKDYSSTLEYVVQDILDTFEEMSKYLSSTISKLNDRYTKDIVDIEREIAGEIKQHQVANQLLRERLEQKTQSESELKRINHSLKNKLSSDYQVIRQLRRDVDFGHEYSRIIENENNKLTKQISILVEEIKQIEHQSEKLRETMQELHKTNHQSLIQKEELKSKIRDSLETNLSTRQKSELMKFIDDNNEDNETNEAFITYSKLCDTDDLNTVTTVSVRFGNIVVPKEVAHKKCQITQNKPLTKEMFTQVNFDQNGGLSKALASLSKSKDLSSEEENSALAPPSNYSKRMNDRKKIENMVVTNPYSSQKNISVPKRSSILVKPALVKQQSLLITSEFMGLGRSGGLTVPVDENIPLSRRNSRSKVQFSNNTNIAEELSNKLEESNQLSPRSRPTLGQIGKKVSLPIPELKSKPKKPLQTSVDKGTKTSAQVKKKLVSQKTVGNFKDIAESVNGSFIYEDQPASTMELDRVDNFENLRETKLRNELIREKQHYLTLSNRLLGCEDDAKKTAEVKSLIEKVTIRIGKLELQLKNLRSKSDIIEKLKQFKPGNLVNRNGPFSSSNILVNCRSTKEGIQ